MSSRNPKKFIHTQPKTYKLTLQAILSFPFRLCNPPPAVGKVRSCSVTPLLQVRLEDVLDRKHLPPLGLKDFEEWLLFVELSPENLYFILWLREYRQRYNQWKSQSAFQSRNAPTDHPLHWAHQHSSHLAMFYARAKQTFFTPGSEYELNLTSSLLAPFHKPNVSPHPDPTLFIDVELETYRTLEESLRRFVNAQLNNVGNRRVLCGIVAGVVFSLVGAIAPLVVNFVRGHSRWSRLAAVPGLWLGLTIFLAALHGVCLAVYLFGDLRQLRKFELSRPPISKPKPLPAFKPRSFIPATRPLSLADPSLLPIQRSGTGNTPAVVVPTPIRDIPHPVVGSHMHNNANVQAGHSRSRVTSTTSTRVSEESTQTDSTDDHIHISPAYYDDDDENDDDCVYYDESAPEEKDTAAVAPGSPLSDETFSATAAFIRPFEPISDDEDELDRSLALPAKHQVMTSFNFDSLPSRPHFPPPTTTTANNTTSPTTAHATVFPTTSSRPPLPHINTFLPSPSHIAIAIPCPPEPAASPSFIARIQERCNIPKWRLQTGYLEPSSPSSSRGSPHLQQQHHHWPHSSSPFWNSAHPNHSHHSNAYSMSSMSMSTSLPSPSPLVSNSNGEKSKGKRKKGTEEGPEKDAKVHRRFRVMNAVPAFAVPLTRILSPVIVRGQWEIVVRSALVACVIAWTLVGSLLAVPPIRARS